MGDNSAQDVTSQVTSCQSQEGGRLTSGDPEDPSPPHLHPHHSPFSSSLSNGVLTPKGFCSKEDRVTTESASSSEAEASLSKANKPAERESGSVSVPKIVARSGFENEIAAADPRPSLEGCSCLLVDAPAGCCQAERRADRSLQNCEGQPDRIKDGGGDSSKADDQSKDMRSTPVSLTPASAQEHDQGLSNSVQHSEQKASLPHTLQNGHVHVHQSAVLNLNDMTVTESKLAPDTSASIQAAPTQQNANQETSTLETLEQNGPHTVDIHDNPVVDIHSSTPPSAAVDHNHAAEHNEEEEVRVHAEDHEEEEHEDEVEEEDEDDVVADEEHVQAVYQAADVDQGRAWVVLVSAFLGMTIFGSFTFSIGIFQAEILQVLEPDIQKTSWVGATHFSTLCMMGPFAGLIKNKLGSRKTVLLSSLIICFGMIAASLSVNVIQIILTYGVITGIGTGMALNPMFICVSFYFERYRGFASGVIAAGAGAGMFIGGPIIRQLMETYGLSGTFLIWGAVGLNIGVAGMVMRPSSLERRKEMRGVLEEEVVVARMGRMDSGLLASLSTLPSVGGYWGSVLGLSSVIVRERTEGDSLTLQRSQNLMEMHNVQDALRSYSELSALSPEAMETAVRSTWLTRNFKSSQLSVGDSLDSTSTGRRRFSPWLFRRDSRPEDLEKGKDAEECSLQHEGASLSKLMSQC